MYEKLLSFAAIGIQITAPSPQKLIYQKNGTIEYSSANNTIAMWYMLETRSYVRSNETYSIVQEGLSITNVQLYHEQLYRCEHLLQSDPFIIRSVIISVELLGKQKSI